MTRDQLGFGEEKEEEEEEEKEALMIILPLILGLDGVKRKKLEEEELQRNPVFRLVSGVHSRREPAFLRGCGPCLLMVDTLALLPHVPVEKCEGRVPYTHNSRDPSA
ncbi:hypothetical protein P7K49_038625 [Saguinus oedipus]|uniref:Uncharacterized protein n=1 Tax=Saguinus oedipus TaxID=9490 RepID=A0ABQ9TFA0_SAGOE|nr:hypothetical protein P7K49_038625 [Saguinus oedipus]